jgi:hypothetical protein
MKHLLPALLAVVVLASCGKKEPSGSPSTSSGGSSSSGTAGGGSEGSVPKELVKGGGTPQEAFDMAKAAGAAKDFGRLYDIVCPDEHDMLVFSAMMMGAFSTMGDEAKGKEFEALTKKYNFPDMEKAPKVDMNDRAALKQALAESLKDVKDKRGFFVEAFTWVEKNAKPGNEAKMHLNGVLKDLKETGDTATGIAVDPDKTEKPLTFRKVDGRWYMALPGR